MSQARTAVAMVVVSSAACAKRQGVLEDVSLEQVIAVPGPPPGCRAIYLLPAPDLAAVAATSVDQALPGTWKGDGGGGCALGVASAEVVPHWMFSPADTGYRGHVRCSVDSVDSPVLQVVDQASPPAGVLGEFTGPPVIEVLDPAIETSPTSAIIARAVDTACPGGDWPGRPPSDWPPLAD